jgi:hypothetical protein
MKLGVVILPAMVWDKVEGFGAGRTGWYGQVRRPKDLAQTSPAHRSNPGSANRDEFERQEYLFVDLRTANRRAGFPFGGARGVGLLGRTAGTTCATLLAVRLAKRETELTTPNFISL